MYIADSGNHRIVRVHLGSTTDICTIGSGPGSDLNQLNEAQDVMATNTSLYVLDTNNCRVQKLSLDGSDSTTVVSYDPSYVSYFLYVDDSGNIYLSVESKHKVLFFSSNASNSKIVAGNGTQGSTHTQLNSPFGVFVNRNGTIYIADHDNGRVMKWIKNGSSGIPVTDTTTRLSRPRGIVVDTNEYMYIVDGGNNQIIRVAPDSMLGTCIASCRGSSSRFLAYSRSLAFDSHGSLYVTDRDGHTVRKFQINPSQSEYFFR